MNEKEVNEYMGQLINGQVKLEAGEQFALDGFVKIGAEIEKAKTKLQEAQAEIEKIVAFAQRANGAREAYVNLLISAERERRRLFPRIRGEGSGSLDDLREKLGADKLELLDNDRNVKESTGE